MPPVYESLFGVAGTAPERPCLLLDDGSTLTYGDLDGQAARMAGALRSRGIRAGDRVVLVVGKSVEAVALYLACLRTGAVLVPLNTAYTAAEVGFFVDDAAAALVVDEATLAELSAGDPDPVVADRTGDDWAAMLYTSGTTGRSKGAMLSCRNLVTNARALHDAWRFSPDDVLVHVLPVFHVHGLFVALHCAFLAGAAVRFHERFDPEHVRADLRRSTVLMGVPTHYHRLLDQTDLDQTDCHGMRLFTSGSAPLSASRHDEFAVRAGHRIVERYGSTEAMILTSNPYDGERVAGTVGFPLDGVELRISVGGVVETRTDGLFLGYWGQPEKTAASFTDDGWFVTGDLGALDTDGRLTLAGREKDLIISGGLNVYPAEIEAVLDEVPGMVESAVVGEPDPDFGERVVAFVVTDRPVDDAVLRRVCDAALARFKHPRRYVFVDELPRNTMGKVQKHRLRGRLHDESG
ncbi:MAG: AMP-binding protein [Acidimicrobiales bacterium]|nr:AMP-binding protein [Acidimicrobiales bacterium]